jgi:hypothetical protein
MDTHRKYVYQLYATGDMQILDETTETRSTTVFCSKEEAEKRIDKFKKLCCDTSRLSAMNHDTIKIEIIKLEII